MSVVRTLEAKDELRVREPDFDTDLWLLNTPTGYVDLRDMTLHSHDPERLMRPMAGCARDMATLYTCDLRLKAWHHVAYWYPIRAGYVDITGRWRGYSLSASRHHQHLMFVQGRGGIGKTQIYEAFLMI